MTRPRPLLLLALAACAPVAGDDALDSDPSEARGGPGDPGPVVLDDGTVVWPAASEVPPWRGAGGPVATFDEGDLFTPCAYLTGDDADIGHHNLMGTYRGHLVMPWAPEFSLHGGVSLFDVADPCAPVKVGEGTSSTMRETHAIGFVHLPEGDPHAGDWAFVNGLEGIASGIQVWDLTDPAAPVAVANLALEGSMYPDAYTTVTLAVSVQYPWLFASAASDGFHVVDISDPTAPVAAFHYTFPQGLRAGPIVAIGDLLMVASTEGNQVALLDVGDPLDPQLLPGSPFTLVGSDGNPHDDYFANLSGHFGLYERKDDGSGPIVFDLTDHEHPAFVGDLLLPGGGGYVFYDEGFLFSGNSHSATVIDGSDLADMEVVGDAVIQGDLDTITPYGHVAVLSVDEDAVAGQASAIVPWAVAPDAKGPVVLSTEPHDGATGVPTTIRVGVGFDEFVDASSAALGAIRLWDADGTPVPGWGSGQEAVASYAPKAELQRGTTYTLEIVAGGVRDLNGNAVADTVTTTFTTVE